MRLLLLDSILLLLISAAAAAASSPSSMMELEIPFGLPPQQPHDYHFPSAAASLMATSRVLIHIPADLHNADGEEHVQAQYGFLSSSGSVSTFVYLIDHNLCNPMQWSKNNTNLYPKPSSKLEGSMLDSPFILLSHHGGCSAVTKTRHAQLAGAAALVIVDDECRCSDSNCTEKFGPQCYDKPITLVNDGSANDISIPSFLLYKLTGQALMAALKKDQPVLLELTWGFPRTSSTPQPEGDNNTKVQPPPVDYHLWTTGHDPLLDYETLRQLQIMTMGMANISRFSPRFAIIDGTRFQCDHMKEKEGPCDNLCTNHGRYCALHAKDLSGHAIVREALRRLCIWKHYGHENTADHHVGVKMYWEYIMYHKEHCWGPREFANETCLAQALAHAQCDLQTVNTCMTESGNVDTDVENTLLQQQVRERSVAGVVTVPAITTNTQGLLNQHSPEALFGAICHYYFQTKTEEIPLKCAACMSCFNKVGCVHNNGTCVGFHTHHDEYTPVPSRGDGSQPTKRGHAWRFFTILLIIGLLGGAYYYYYTHRDDFDERRGILNGYLQLTGEG